MKKKNEFFWQHIRRFDTISNKYDHQMYMYIYLWQLSGYLNLKDWNYFTVFLSLRRGEDFSMYYGK